MVPLFTDKFYLIVHFFITIFINFNKVTGLFITFSGFHFIYIYF